MTIDATLGERSASELADAGADVRLEIGDVAEPEVAEAACRRGVDAWGRIDILVNNAGIGGINRDIWELPVEEMDRVYRTNYAVSTSSAKRSSLTCWSATTAA